MKTMLTRAAMMAVLTAIPATPSLAQQEYEPTDTQCRGRLLDAAEIRVNQTGPVIGEVQIYYEAAKDLFCGRTVRLGQAKGIRTYTDVWMYKHQVRGGPFQVGSHQEGLYEQVAGPVGSRAPCMHTEGGVRWNGTTYATTTRTFCR